MRRNAVTPRKRSVEPTVKMLKSVDVRCAVWLAKRGLKAVFGGHRFGKGVA